MGIGEDVSVEPNPELSGICEVFTTPPKQIIQKYECLVIIFIAHMVSRVALSTVFIVAPETVIEPKADI